MKSIVLQKLVITNFKGIKNLIINFSEITDIFGANGLGKTTIFDSFTWLLFGKDSLDRKDFEIKPLDSNGISIPKIENEVEGTLLFNGEEIVLKRIHREKWVKKRGLSEPEFNGNETIYFWNDVPMSAKEYTSKINELLDEQVFKLISNPLAFNNLKWQDRRKVLIDIVGETNVNYIDNDLGHILELTKKKTIAELKAEVNAKVKKIKEELKQIPTRIDEAERGKPEAINFESLEHDLKLWERDLERIDKELQDSSSKNQFLINRKTEIQNEIFGFKSKLQAIEFELGNTARAKTQKDTSKLDALNQRLQSLNLELSNAQSNLKQVEANRDYESDRLGKIQKKMEYKRLEWQNENYQTLTFNENDFHCPTCKREFESGDVETKKAEALTNFNTNKAKRLNEINLQGGNLKTESENIQKYLDQQTERVEQFQTNINKVSEDIKSLQSAIELEQNIVSGTDTPSFEKVFTELLISHVEYNSIKDSIQAKEQELANIQPISNSELEQLKRETFGNINIVKQQLNTKFQIAAADNRIYELKQEEQSLSASLLELEKQEFDIEKYIRLSIEALENNINQKFEHVTFKLFETQINGGEIECCEALINGVPFHNANTASKINAGIDIINTLCNFYNTNAPIFIDNRESVTELINSKSQIINLIVSKSDKTIRVEAPLLFAHS
ncbi:recombinase RecF [Paenimyroides tangerinum]|uniref:Recombinase RecF n=1 Tax=Paenimyroides tangerinum TaxID=2488728 RepID=A0A3P3WD52_9FLAO|nr:AAA family ATPase [Paenimyroides tangerinum]RRJ91559.1 recombinase RecF [Paenimyroides tangerinum]